MKNPYIVKNILGIIIGMVIINSIVFIVAHLLSNGQNIPAMFTALLGSAIPFLLTLFLRIPILQRKIIIGIILSFIGSFLTAMFFSNYRSVQKQSEGEEIKKELTVNEVMALERKHFFQLDRSKTRILSTHRGITYEADSRGNEEPYIVFPIVDGAWMQKDTLRIWVAYRLKGEWMGKEEEDHLKQINSANAVGFLESREYYLEVYSRAIDDAVKKKNLIASEQPLILELIDKEIEASFWKNRFLLFLSIINGLWLLATVGGVRKGFEVTKDESSK